MDCQKPVCSLLSLQYTATPKSLWCTWENLWMARGNCATVKTNRPPAGSGLFLLADWRQCLLHHFQKLWRPNGCVSSKQNNSTQISQHKESDFGLDKLQGKGLCGNSHKHVSVSTWKCPLLQFSCWTVLFTGQGNII